MTAQEKQLLTLGALGALAYWLWFTGSGQTAAEAAGDIFSSEPQPSGPLPTIGPQESTFNLIANYEQFSPTPYRDADGWSIGYGHYMGKTPTMQQISQADAWGLLQSDVASISVPALALVRVPVTQNQYDALSSLAYNIGQGAFASSTLLVLLNNGDYAGAAAQFPRWNRSQGQVLQVLVDRRANEQQIFNA